MTEQASTATKTTSELIETLAAKLLPRIPKSDRPAEDDIAMAMADRRRWRKTKHGMQAIQLATDALRCGDGVMAWPTTGLLRNGVISWPIVITDSDDPDYREPSAITLGEMTAKVKHHQIEAGIEKPAHLLICLIRGWEEWTSLKALNFEDGRIEWSKEMNVSFIPKMNDVVYGMLRNTDIEAFVTPDGLKVGEWSRADAGRLWSGTRPPKSHLSFAPRTSQNVMVTTSRNVRMDSTSISPDCPTIIAMRDTFGGMDQRAGQYLGDIERFSYLAMSLRHYTLIPVQFLIKYLMKEPPQKKMRWAKGHKTRAVKAIEGLRSLAITTPSGFPAWIADVDFSSHDKDGFPIYGIGRAEWYQRAMDPSLKEPLAIRLSGGLFWQMSSSKESYLINRFYAVAESLLHNSGGQEATTKFASKRKYIRLPVAMHPSNKDWWFEFTIREWADICGIPYQDSIPKSKNKVYRQLLNVREKLMDKQMSDRHAGKVMTVEWDAPAAYDRSYIRFRATDEYRKAYRMEKKDLMRIATLDELLGSINE